MIIMKKLIDSLPSPEGQNITDNPGNPQGWAGKAAQFVLGIIARGRGQNTNIPVEPTEDPLLAFGEFALTSPENLGTINTTPFHITAPDPFENRLSDELRGLLPWDIQFQLTPNDLSREQVIQSLLRAKQDWESFRALGIQPPTGEFEAITQALEHAFAYKREERLHGEQIAKIGMIHSIAMQLLVSSVGTITRTMDNKKYGRWTEQQVKSVLTGDPEGVQITPPSPLIPFVAALSAIHTYMDVPKILAEGHYGHGLDRLREIAQVISPALLTDEPFDLDLPVTTNASQGPASLAVFLFEEPSEIPNRLTRQELHALLDKNELLEVQLRDFLVGLADHPRVEVIDGKKVVFDFITSDIVIAELGHTFSILLEQLNSADEYSRNRFRVQLELTLEKNLRWLEEQDGMFRVVRDTITKDAAYYWERYRPHIKKRQPQTIYRVKRVHGEKSMPPKSSNGSYVNPYFIAPPSYAEDEVLDTTPTTTHLTKLAEHAIQLPQWKRSLSEIALIATRYAYPKDISFFSNLHLDEVADRVKFSNSREIPTPQDIGLLVDMLDAIMFDRNYLGADKSQIEALFGLVEPTPVFNQFVSQWIEKFERSSDIGSKPATLQFLYNTGKVYQLLAVKAVTKYEISKIFSRLIAIARVEERKRTGR